VFVNYSLFFVFELFPLHPQPHMRPIVGHSPCKIYIYFYSVNLFSYFSNTLLGKWRNQKVCFNLSHHTVVLKNAVRSSSLVNIYFPGHPICCPSCMIMTRKINIADSCTLGTWLDQCSACPYIVDGFSCFPAPVGYHQLKSAIWKHCMESVLCGAPVSFVLVIWLENWWMLFFLNELFPPWPTWMWTWDWVGSSSSELLFVWSIGESQLNSLRWG
jgi:hypothetical protein